MIFIAFFIGIAYSVPLGPLGQIMLNRAVDRGFWHGFSMGIIGSFANFAYSFIFLIGTGILITDGRTKTIIQAVGLVFLIYIGFKELLRSSGKTTKYYSIVTEKPGNTFSPFGWKNFLEGLVIVITYFISNPTIVAFWINMSAYFNQKLIHHPNVWNYAVFSLSFALGTLTCQFLAIELYKRMRELPRFSTTVRFISSGLFAVTIAYFFYLTIQNMSVNFL